MSATRDSAGIGRGDVAGNLAYQMVRSFRDGAYRMLAKATCARCHEEAELYANEGNDPFRIKRKFHNRGWDFTPYDATKCVCPRCKAKEKPREGEPVMLTNPAATAGAALQRRRPNGANGHHPGDRLQPLLQELPQTPIPAIAVSPAIAVTKVELPRHLNPDEKAKVRHLLDLHFDDGKGSYIDGYSDKRIGEETEIPWASVKLLREAAYGPIKEDPAILAVKAELAELRRDIAPAIDKVTRAQAGVAQAVDGMRALEERLSTAEQKLEKLRQR